MEKHNCKLCHRKFANGRALGGHMRSHMMTLPTVPKLESRPSNETESSSLAESPSSSSSEDDAQEEGVMEKGVLNSKKSVKLVDLEDRESETESTRNPTRRRSKRLRKPPPSPLPLPLPPPFDYGSDRELVSSISAVSSEEDVAFCLMMLSRDKWTSHERDFGDISNGFADVTDYESRFRCETCNKVFRSYQALGGHRSSHKKTRVAAYAIPDTLHTVDNDDDNNDNNNYKIVVRDYGEKKKIHKCPVCHKVFKSGQALGGHKRSHGIGYIEKDNQEPFDDDDDDDFIDDDKSGKKIKSGNILIDLNLPAPVEDEEISQIDVSAVSDAHF